MKENKDKSWKLSEEEISIAENEGQGLILQMDGNLHACPSLLKSDPNPQNRNDKLFIEFLEIL